MWKQLPIGSPQIHSGKRWLLVTDGQTIGKKGMNRNIKIHCYLERQLRLGTIIRVMTFAFYYLNQQTSVIKPRKKTTVGFFWHQILSHLSQFHTMVFIVQQYHISSIAFHAKTQNNPGFYSLDCIIPQIQWCCVIPDPFSKCNNSVLLVLEMTFILKTMQVKLCTKLPILVGDPHGDLRLEDLLGMQFESLHFSTSGI